MKKILIVILTCCLFSACGKKEVLSTEQNAEELIKQSNSAEKQNDEVNPEEKTMAKTATDEVAEKYAVYERLIVIDPGHGTGGNNEKESMAPGSSVKKAAYVSGTAGKNQTEEELNLIVAKKLKKALEDRGAVVYMTREGHKAELSNVGRAKFANDLNADICVRIHADGSESTAAHGVSVLLPSSEYIKNDELIQKSKIAGEMILEEYVKATGAKNRGTTLRSDMTGFNWSEVPVVLIELGFMSNPEEDALMETEDYQSKMASGIAQGLERYFTER